MTALRFQTGGDIRYPLPPSGGRRTVLQRGRGGEGGEEKRERAVKIISEMDAVLTALGKYYIIAWENLD